MKVLMVHKFYFIEGGAERYMFNLSTILEQNGTEIIPFAMLHPRTEPTLYQKYFVSNFDPDGVLKNLNILNGIKSVARVIYNTEAQKKLEQLIDRTKPDVAHVHGVYHHLSPSVLYTLKKRNLPVIFTLHEYKILCPSFLFLDRHRNICERCEGKHFWHPIQQRCLKNSLAASTLVSAEAYVHRLLGSYRKNVDLYLSPSTFLRDKMIQYGYPPEKVRHLPYTIPIEEYKPKYSHKNYFTYIGRLSLEKGIELLVHAMEYISGSDLYICGTGRLREPLEKWVEEKGLKNVKFLGHLSGDELRDVMRNSMFTVVPSIVYDNSPLAIYESLALGKPVVGARIGGIPELIDEGETGYLFEPSDKESLVEAVQKMLGEKQNFAAMGKQARKKAEREFAPETHRTKIIEIYNQYLNKNLK